MTTPEAKVVPVKALAGIEQVLPKVQVCPLTVVETFAKALFGIAPAATASVGVVVLLVTVGTSHVGQSTVFAIKSVTDPPPVPDPVKLQVVVVQDPAPAEKVKVKAPAVPLIEDTPATGTAVTERFPAASIATRPEEPTPGIPDSFAVPESTRELRLTAAGNVKVLAVVMP